MKKKIVNRLKYDYQDYLTNVHGSTLTMKPPHSDFILTMKVKAWVVEMTAEQSFNEIGYKLVDNAIPNLSYSKIVNKKINKTESEKRTFWVVFDKTAKFWWAQENVERYMLKVLQYRTSMTVLIDTKLHNAIAQQVKELEWWK